MLHGGLEHEWNETTPDVGNVPNFEGDLPGPEVNPNDGTGWFPDTNQPVEAGLDWAAGSTDEALGGIGNQPVEGFLDWGAGSTDEAVGNVGPRPLEGFLDWAGGSADESAGQIGSGIAQFGSQMTMIFGLGALALFGLFGYMVIS